MEDQPIKDLTLKAESTFDQKDLVKPLDNTDSILLLKCPKCGHTHFRHAGYMITVTPYLEIKTQSVNNVSTNNPVHICIKCKTAILAVEGKIHDVTDHVDFEAWNKTEKIAHETTGPGGQC